MSTTPPATPTGPRPPSTRAAARRSASERRAARTHELFSLALSVESADERRERLDSVIEMHLEIAHSEAARYRNRGIALDDLRQVAALGLTKAALRYDVTSGHEFLSYAGPTIRGELRRHFRDHGWMVRPPRRIQELQARIAAARESLSFELGRSPQPSDLASHLGESLESVNEAVASDGCFVPASLDHRAGDERSSTLGELLPTEDTAFATTEAQIILGPLVSQLPERDRQILRLRFHDGLTQREVGARLGISQMQISRLLTRILAQLRNGIGDIALP